MSRLAPIKRRVAPYVGAAEMCSLSVVARSPVHATRSGLLRFWGADVHPDAVLYHGFQVRAARNLRIGARANIGDGAILDARGGLTIGEDVNFSTRVQIWTAQHGWNAPDFAYEQAPVVVEDHVWIGPNVTVLPGSTIRRGAVIAANAVVKGEIEEFSLYGGIPARKLGERTRELTYRLPTPKGKTPWW